MDGHILRETYRYLGYGKREPEEKEKEQILDCIRELTPALSPRFLYREFPLSILPDGSINVTFCVIKSRNLAKNLGGCHKILFFAATLGSGVDVLLHRYSRLQISRAVIMQAASAAMLEAFCNEKNNLLKERYEAQGLYLRPRFSPGYGDFPLEFQRDFFRIMNCQKEIGLSLTDSLLMTPSKSVSALIGVSKTPTPCLLEGCEACGNMECPYRR